MEPIAVTIHSRAKPWLAASTDDTRTNLQVVRILPNGAAIASDGHVGVYVADFMAHADPTDKGSLPDLTFASDVLAKTLSQIKARDCFDRIPAVLSDPGNGYTALKLGAELWVLQTEAEMPNLMGVMCENKPAPPMPDSVGLNVLYLHKLAKVFGCNGTKDSSKWAFEFGLPKPKRDASWPDTWTILRPMHTDSVSQAPGFAIIMPVRPKSGDKDDDHDHGVWDDWRALVPMLKQLK